MTYNYAHFPEDMDAEHFAAFRDGAPRAGSRAPNGTLETLEGDAITLKSLWKRGPLVIEFGSFT